MADIFTPKKRSDIMGRIRSRGNRDTELVLARFFRVHGITGWRRNLRVFGRPDFLFRARRLAVFVDGCFWHGCPRHGRMPRTNATFWRDKIARNRARDRLVTRTLRRAGWQVLRLWEHDLARKHEGRLLRRFNHQGSKAPRGKILTTNHTKGEF